MVVDARQVMAPKASNLRLSYADTICVSSRQSSRIFTQVQSRFFTLISTRRLALLTTTFTSSLSVVRLYRINNMIVFGSSPEYVKCFE